MSGSAPIVSPYCLALTGGIACGKSTVGTELAKMGLRRVDADLVARLVVEPGTPGLGSLVEAFGPGILAPDGTLDRAAMGSLVFADPSARTKLESILHPLIWESMALSVQQAHDEACETVFEIPLLFEKGSQNRFSTVWVVSAPLEVQLQRLRARDGFSEEEALARIRSQMSVLEKAAMADFVLENDGDRAKLLAQISQGHALWRSTREAP